MEPLFETDLSSVIREVAADLGPNGASPASVGFEAGTDPEGDGATAIITTYPIDWDNQRLTCPCCQSNNLGIRVVSELGVDRLQLVQMMSEFADLKATTIIEAVVSPGAEPTLESQLQPLSSGTLPGLPGGRPEKGVFREDGDEIRRSTRLKGKVRTKRRNFIPEEDTSDEFEEPVTVRTKIKTIKKPFFPNKLLKTPKLASRSKKTTVRKVGKNSGKVTTVVICTRKGAPTGASNDGESKLSSESGPSRPSQVITVSKGFVGQINLQLPPDGSKEQAATVILKCTQKGCQKTFLDGHQLNLHMKEHQGVVVHKCDWTGCSRLFSSAERLRDHVRLIHTKERPFKCRDCDKAFGSNKHLNAHRMLHTGERPFKCDWPGCDVRFRRSHHLTAHRRRHTGERPYPCSYPGCGMRFAKSDHCKRHYAIHFKPSPVEPELKPKPLKHVSDDEDTVEKSLELTVDYELEDDFDPVVPPLNDCLKLEESDSNKDGDTFLDETDGCIKELTVVHL